MKQTHAWKGLALVWLAATSVAAYADITIKEQPGQARPEVARAWRPVPGAPAPDFALKRHDTGETVRGSDFKGKVVLLNFFATWCGPCVNETPDFVKVYKTYKEKGVAFVSVDTGEKGRDPKVVIPEFVNKMGVTWPVLIEDTVNPLKKLYGVRGIPTNVVIGKDGIIRYCRSGGMSEAQLTQLLDQALSGAPISAETPAAAPVQANAPEKKASAPMVGAPAMDFSLKRYDTGESVKLSDFKGKKTVLVNFFATWCGPCKSETPDFVKAYPEYKDKDVEFISVDVGERGDAQEAVKKFTEQYGVVWPVLMDETSVGAARQYQVRGIPTNVIVNKEGVIKFYQAGGISESVLKKQLDRALAQVNGAQANPFANDPD